MLKFMQRLGVLRVLLLGSALLSAVSMLWVDTTLPPEGLGLLRSAVLPALAPIVFMVLLLDLLMCRLVRASQDTEDERKRDLNLISRIHLLVAVVLLLSWLPVFFRATNF